MGEQPTMLSLRECAARLCVSPQTLYQWRHRGEGPIGYRFGKGRVRYRPADVEAWIESQRDEPREQPRQPIGA